MHIVESLRSSGGPHDVAVRDHLDRVWRVFDRIRNISLDSQKKGNAKDTVRLFADRQPYRATILVDITVFEVIEI